MSWFLFPILPGIDLTLEDVVYDDDKDEGFRWLGLSTEHTWEW